MLFSLVFIYFSYLCRKFECEMEQLKHERGVAMVRLLNPLSHFQKEYGAWSGRLDASVSRMDRQQNSSLTSVGFAHVKLQSGFCKTYLFREGTLGRDVMSELFVSVHKHYKELSKEQVSDELYVKKHLPFAGKENMGHLRYSTTGMSGLSYAHSFWGHGKRYLRKCHVGGECTMTNEDRVFALYNESEYNNKE